MSKKTEVTVKSNGLRNELKEIRKSIDKLTEVILLQQTNKQNEKNKKNSESQYWGDSIDGMYFTTSSTERETSIKNENISKNN
tara:strand:+ start:223 stop:471 length:249 start_codon:yes stop_codon:yes gene_type:complete